MGPKEQEMIRTKAMYNKDYYWANKKSENTRSNNWKKNNKEKIRETEKSYRQKEVGHFKQLWHGVAKSKHGNSFKNFDDFFSHWLEQKEVHGMICPATGVKMTMISRSGETRQNPQPTNISRDRILSNRQYSKQNLIFTTWKYNNSKSDLSPKEAKAYLRIVRERYGSDEIE